MAGPATHTTHVTRRNLLRGNIGAPSIDPPPVSISDTCLTRAGVSCRLCEDACEPRAIRFAPRPGGVFQPALDGARCTACLACVEVCPVHAIHPHRVSDDG